MKELLNKLDNISSDIAEDVVNEGQYDGKSREELLKMKAEAEASIKNMKPSGNDPQSQFYDETQMMMAQQHLDSINNALKKLGEDVDESKSSGDAWYKEQRAKEAYEKANPGKRWADLPYGYKEDWRKKTESVETDAEVVEAVGNSAEAFYELQDEFCGGECPSHAHRALIDELIRSMSGDEVKRFVDDFRRHYDMNDMEESVKVNEHDTSLLMKVVDQMKKDAEMGDYTAIEELLKAIPAASLQSFLSDVDEAIEESVEETANTPELDSYIKEMDSDDQVQEDCACEDTVEETVEVAVDDLRSLIALAGLQPKATTEATVELDEYANSPDEDYQDTDVQLNKMSGGLNGPKGQHKKEYPGDNPLAAELADKLKAMLEK